jgi:BirA family biotin operon repressor/biotin-[acetyl-CoA-carboxylase] ligase
MNFTIHRFESVGSTMHEAARLAAADHPEGTVVLAEEQTQGHGRYGRPWHSERGSGLYFTLILRPKLCPDSLPLVTLALGLAVGESIQSCTGLPVDLRWPNDVMVRERKCAGILAQLADGVLLAGIGINVNQKSFPPDVVEIATSLRMASGHEFDREELLQRTLTAVAARLDGLLQQGRAPVLDAFSRASSYVRGKRVLVDDGGSQLRGVTEGLDPQGFLMLRTADGQRTKVLAGGVRSDVAGA